MQRVLLLNSYHEGYAWTDELVRGVRAGLASSHLPIDLDIEYLDWRRHEDQKHMELFADFLRGKFAETPRWTSSSRPMIPPSVS